MDASSFTFKLNVPRDAALAGLVADVVAHAATYAGMLEPAGKAFAAKASEAAAAELGAGDGANCLVVLASADGELSAAIGERTVSQKISE